MFAELHETYKNPDGTMNEHVYMVPGGIGKRPGVGEILKDLRLDSADYMHLFERDAQYGRHLHAAIEMLEGGNLDEDALDDALKYPLEGYRRWKENTGAYPYHDPEPEGHRWNEISLYSTDLGYCGTPDGLYVLGHSGQWCIPDWKTGVVTWLHKVKAAAYEILIREHMSTKFFGGEKIALLALELNGKDYKYKEHDLCHVYAQTFWRSCLNVYRGKCQINW